MWIDFRYQKILIVGCGGAGKSTLAVKLGKITALPVVHLDKLWWLPGWKERTEDEFDRMLDVELRKPAWIIEGNYARTFERRMGFADLCVFLDYSSELCIKSVYERARMYNGKTRPDMTDGCIERVDDEFERWIRSFENEIKPKMTETIKRSGVPCEIFGSREDADAWLAAIGK